MESLEINATSFQDQIEIEITPERRLIIGPTPRVRGILLDDNGVKNQHNSLQVEYLGDADLAPSKATSVIVYTNKLQGKLILTKN